MKFYFVVKRVVVILIIFLAGCQPKANITVIDHPMTSFTSNSSDTIRGAKSVEDLSCYFFQSLKGDISFEQLSRFIPDSSDIADMYRLTKTNVGNANLKANADTAQQLLLRGWIKTRSEASELKANWSDASFEKLRIIDIENQKLPSKKILLECKAGEITLRAVAKCMMIGDRWYIGEDIKFGV